MNGRANIVNTNRDEGGAELLGEDICFRYDGRDVLRAVNVRITPGRATVLVGPSGAGKTTLLWILSGLLEPASGCVRFAGGKALRKLYRAASVGMVFQQPALWEHLTVVKHLELVLAGRALARSRRAELVDQALEQMDLVAFRRRRPGQLSGGQRQRLAVARAIVARPKWLLLDEPLAHLDGRARDDFFALLTDALTRTRAGVLLATHHGRDAMRLADEIVVLLAGRVCQADAAAEVYRHPVSLAAARVLGPACAVRGEAGGGMLKQGGRAVLESLPADMSGPVELILRPENLRFDPCSQGPAEVLGCEFIGEAYRLDVKAGDVRVLVHQPRAAPPATTGRLRWLA